MSFSDDQYYDTRPDDDENDIDSNNQFHAVYQCYSPAFVGDRDGINIENGGKILLPQAALEQLIDHTGVMLFKLKNPKNDRLTHCGVLEFLHSDEPICYLPHWMMQHLLLDEGDEIIIESMHPLPSATFARFQPQEKDFLNLTNPKAVLENLLRNFSCLTKGDLITINYLNRNYKLLVLELKPSNVVSIIECDMEVDFALPTDAKSISTTVNDQKIYINPSTLISSVGLENFLNDKLKPNDKSEQNNMEFLPIRGIPNYNYKYGLLQFPRTPLRYLNDDINNKLERKSSNLFQPFTGEGKILRQPRNQQPT
ncbi:unnamed protein product [Adineta steineri]|uniref:Ubiquitin fusion degradaton protein n=1 Tax=Adineta steineri TaxID=433720 RepID=A0A815SG08_9BILA|nr:unnamed protein product [Adineta steineri]